MPLVRVMTPEMPVASIVSPSVAIASACRNESGPLSLVLLTMMVVAFAEIARAQAKLNRVPTALNLLTLLIPVELHGNCNYLKVTWLSLS